MGPTVLVVDDDPALVEALSEVLRDEGYVVEGQTDPTKALERLRSGPPPDVILLDFVMPRMNGGDFLLGMRAAGLRTPVILFTALSDPAAVASAPEVVCVIQKPFDLELLLGEVGRVVKSGRPAA